jgi:hypothetical protein
MSGTIAQYLGEDQFGRWIGVFEGDPWWNAERTRHGVFIEPLVKVIPEGTFWTACFYPGATAVDVDIVVPVIWNDDVLEEIDLEMDILRSADGVVSVRDEDEFERVRREWNMPDEIAERALETFAQIREEVALGVEPFGDVGERWLRDFLS